MHRAPEIHIKQRPPILDRDHLGFAHDDSTCIVKDNVQSTKDRLGSRKRMINVRWIGDVDVEHEQFVLWVARREILEYLGLPERRNDDLALLQDKLGQGSSEPRRCAGD